MLHDLVQTELAREESSSDECCALTARRPVMDSGPSAEKKDNDGCRRRRQQELELSRMKKNEDSKKHPLRSKGGWILTRVELFLISLDRIIVS